MDMKHHIVVICSRFNENITRALMEGALTALREAGIADEQIEQIWVPGAFEIPVTALIAAQRPEVSAVVCLGAVIRGETPHFEYVSQAAATGIQRASLETGKPVAFGVLTTDTVEQAFDRAGGKTGNKGAEAAAAAVEMIKTLKQAKGSKSGEL